MLFLALLAPLPRLSDADTSLHLARNGSVEINASNRDVTVRVGATDLVTVRGGAVDGTSRSVEIDEDPRSRGSAIEVILPAWARLEISSVSGNITLSGSPDRTQAETVNGNIRVDNGTGRLELTSVAGAIAVNNFRGTQLSIDGTNQNIDVTNASGEIKIENVNGHIVMHGIHSSSVSAETVNGDVEYGGEFNAGGSYAFATQNNNVTLLVPADFSARLRVTTFNGKLLTDIPATTTGNTSGARGDRKSQDDDGERSFTALYGSGSARVSVDVFNGNAVVRRTTARE